MVVRDTKTFLTYSGYPNWLWFLKSEYSTVLDAFPKVILSEHEADHSHLAPKLRICR